MAPPHKKKTLFEDDDNDNEQQNDVSGSSLRIDKKYATAFESRKQKEELRQLALDDNDDDVSATSSSDEDSDAELLTEELDVNIFKTINALRSKDEKIYDSKVRFFDNTGSDDGSDSDDDESDDKKKRSKPKRYKDVIREQVLEQMEQEEASSGVKGSRDDGPNKSSSRLAYDMEQEEIRKAFLKATKDGDHGDSSDKDEDEDNLLTVKRRHKPTDQNLSKELEQELEKLRSTAGDSKDLVDPRGEVKDGEAFLLDYFKKKTWKREDGDSDSESDDASNEGLPMKGASVNAADDDDSLEDVDKADDFEAQYNFRFEQAAAASASGADHSLVTYARDMSGTLRRKDESRKEKRVARKERKAAERKAKEEELKRLKNLKRQEMNSKLKEVKAVLGEAEGRGAAVDEAAILKLIEGDFDPDKYEELMKEAYGDDFYNNEDAEWKSEIDIRNTLKSEEDGVMLVGQDDEEGGLYDDDAYNEDQEYADQDYDEEYAYDDEEEEAWAEEEALEEGESETPLERQIREKLADELYKLDYEDIVAGQPTRFKYRKVEPNSYGLTTEEILFARDTTLRQFVSLKQMAPYNEREYHVNSKKRRRFRDLLKQELEAEEPEQPEEKDADRDPEEEVEKPMKKSRRSKKSNKSKASSDDTEDQVSPEEKTEEIALVDSKPASDNSTEKKKKKRKKKHKNKEATVPGLSTSRLAAYGL